MNKTAVLLTIIITLFSLPVVAQECYTLCQDTDACWDENAAVCEECSTSCDDCDNLDPICDKLDTNCNNCDDETCQSCQNAEKCWQKSSELCQQCDDSCAECEELDTECEDIDTKCDNCQENKKSDKIDSNDASNQDEPNDDDDDDDQTTDENIRNDDSVTKNSFHYQLQDATFSPLSALDVSYIVIDIDDAKLTKQQLTSLKPITLSYISIGEAENYRSYWQSEWKTGNPSFIEFENPDWAGNYKVEYWDQEWQNIVLNNVKSIANAGYDGVYLDIVDAYYYFEEKGRTTAADDMIDFIQSIRQTGKAINPDFLIVPQNAVELYGFEEYRPIIDGFGKEDTWYNDDTKQEEQETSYNLPFLQQARNDGKFILAIDYPTTQTNICAFYTVCNTENFQCTVSNRALDQLTPTKCNSILASTTTECNGCVQANKCIPFGTRLEESFCSLNGNVQPFSTSCNNSYECDSNVCVNDACIERNFIDRLFAWFLHWF